MKSLKKNVFLRLNSCLLFVKICAGIANKIVKMIILKKSILLALLTILSITGCYAMRLDELGLVDYGGTLTIDKLGFDNPKYLILYKLNLQLMQLIRL
jgi:hypothetical protein